MGRLMVSVSAETPGGSFTNAAGGSIRADELAVALTGNVGGDFTNNGEILSTGSHGAYISGELLGDFINTGTIRAEDISVMLDG